MLPDGSEATVLELGMAVNVYIPRDGKVMYEVDIWWNWNSVVGVATRLGDGLYRVRISAVLRDFSLLQSPDQLLGPLSLLLSGYRGSFTRVRRTGIEAFLSPPSSAEVKIEWSYTSTLPMDRNSFSFTFIDLRNTYFTMVNYTRSMCFYVATHYNDSRANYLLFNYCRTCQNGPAFEKIMNI
jgi:hypothetical protein